MLTAPPLTNAAPVEVKLADNATDEEKKAAEAAKKAAEETKKLREHEQQSLKDYFLVAKFAPVSA